MDVLLNDEEIWETIGRSKTTYEEDMAIVAEAQLKKVVELIGDIDLPSVSDFSQDPKDTDSYVYGYNDGQEKTLDAIEEALLKEIE